MNRPAITDMHTLEDLAAWAASNHKGGFLTADWMPLLRQAAAIQNRRLTNAGNRVCSYLAEHAEFSNCVHEMAACQRWCAEEGKVRGAGRGAKIKNQQEAK